MTPFIFADVKYGRRQPYEKHNAGNLYQLERQENRFMPLGLQKGMYLCQNLDFVSVSPVSYFTCTELCK
jgi:hypothetical protein